MEKPNAQQPPTVNDTLETTPTAGDTTAETDQESLDAWIERANRMHELVDAVDLQKVAEHDPTEVSKAANVTQALNELSIGGAIDRVEGVDAVVPELDARHEQLAVLVEQLTEGGWGERLGRVLHVNPDGETLKPLDIIPHTEGLPVFDICVAPRESVGMGYFTLIISDVAVFAAAVNEPATRHHWRVYRSRPYDTPAEMLQVIKQFSRTAFE